MPRILQLVAAANTPTQITGSNLLFRNATFFGYKGFAAGGTPTSNTSTVYYGINSGECAMQVTAGSSAAYTITTTQERDNLGNYYFQSATNGDGIYILFN